MTFADFAWLLMTLNVLAYSSCFRCMSCMSIIISQLQPDDKKRSKDEQGKRSSKERSSQRSDAEKREQKVVCCLWVIIGYLCFLKACISFPSIFCINPQSYMTVSYSNSREEDIHCTLRVFFKLGTIFFIDNQYTCRNLKNYSYKKVESLSLFSRWEPVILSNCSFF